MTRAQDQIDAAIDLVRRTIVDREPTGRTRDLDPLEQHGAISDETARGLLLVIGGLLQVLEMQGLGLFAIRAKLVEVTGDQTDAPQRAAMSEAEYLQTLASMLHTLYADGARRDSV
jgi:hypothetical protein